MAFFRLVPEHSLRSVPSLKSPQQFPLPNDVTASAQPGAAAVTYRIPTGYCRLSPPAHSSDRSNHSHRPARTATAAEHRFPDTGAEAERGSQPHTKSPTQTTLKNAKPTIHRSPLTEGTQGTPLRPVPLTPVAADGRTAPPLPRPLPAGDQTR